ncbi:MAG TPA: BlaI/MecI/CopY family transcriptional regulator, partial [Thermoanaerobaculia bacterium]|nr:BlaI/MecI/CopY family transcriptional regulator [Thermoanaerobaculia bacterium]
FPAAAYTTLMTTLDRLYRKGVLERVKQGRAYLYRPRFGRDELDALMAAGAIQELLGHRSGALRPALSFLVDAASRTDTRVLDELEALLRERRDREGKRR